MKNKLFGFPLTFVLLIITTVAIILGTFIEAATSTANARQLVYNATWFEVVLALLTINITGSMFYHRAFSWKKITVPLFHLSFVLVMIGAMFTRYTGVEGSVYIREGEKSNVVELIDQGGALELPFHLHLDDFELERYPGSNSPSSYSSYVTVEDQELEQAFQYHIYMNHILIYRGWRFFQTSYDQDEKGTVLTASHDTIGTPLTYAGYFLTIATLFLSLFMPGTFFRKQLRKLGSMGTLVLLLLIPLFGFSNKPIDESKVIDKAQAHEFGEVVVQDYKGRMKTMNTLSSEFMRKLYGAEQLDGLSSDQVILSMITWPEYWATVPLLKVKNKEVARELQIDGKHLSFTGLFSRDGKYIMAGPVDKAFQTPEAQRSKTDQSFLKLDDKANILHAFLTGDAMALFPIEGAENNKWYTHHDAALQAKASDDSLFLTHILPLYIDALKQGKSSGDFSQADSYLEAIKNYQQKEGSEVVLSPSQIKAELFYNRSHLFERLENSFALTGFIMLLLFFIFILRGKGFPHLIFNIFFVLSIVLLLFTIVGIALRWYIGGYIPISNSFEVMIFLSGVVLLAGLLVSRKQPVALALSLILAYAFLFVASMNNGNPEIGNLVPVLKSYWLSIHVAVITSSYALFALVMMLALLNLTLYLFASPSRFERLLVKTGQLNALINVMMTIGLYLLTIGTILGGIWANESWGRYWGWDPKETWALISIFVYAFVAHMRFIPSMKDEFWFNMASFWAFASILMTFFGVNYFLAGLHSYAGVEKATMPGWISYTAGAFALYTIVSGIRYFKLKEKEL
ncbi:cytochrome c biogenesis protein [Roseimarinus sediminis]|uniref:cytochrome c biogenesis protein n=1 Tax=Roseimarinus sediminis TaxID=1610899 RepID=UPI003D234397